LGGAGSGNWYRWDKRAAVEDYRSVDMRRWHRDGLLRPGTPFSWLWWDEEGNKKASIVVYMLSEASIKLDYRYRSGESEWQNIEEPVSVEWTPCNYGGKRPWFRCPGVVNGRYCGRRVAILYAASPYFLCRHCYRLPYASQSETEADRLLRKANKIRRRLGGKPGLGYSFPAKPKGEILVADPQAKAVFRIGADGEVTTVFKSP
jgi:hypothetical protein